LIFPFWRDYIQGFSELAEAFTDSTDENVPDRIPLNEMAHDAFIKPTLKGFYARLFKIHSTL
jgi:hypothetical protein